MAKIIPQFGLDKNFYKSINKLEFISAYSQEYKWYWRIDTNILKKYNFLEIKDSLYNCSSDTDNIKKFLLTLSDMLFPFDNFMSELSKSQQLNTKKYTVCADLVDGYKCNDGSLIFTLINKHKIYRTIKVYYSKTNHKSDTPDDKLRELNNKRVIVSGPVTFYASKKYASIQIEAIFIEPIDECSRIVESKSNEHNYESFLTNKCAKPIADIKTIGLITGCNNKGEFNKGGDDFIANLPYNLKKQDKTGKYIHLNIKYANMLDANEIKEKILELNEENNCQIIAIIRGGGSAESLACYSTESSLIEAVHKSNIPVLTGIGHSSDKILLNSIADYHTNTPADAANFISSEYHKHQCNNQYKKSTKPTSRTITNNLKIILNEFLYKIKTFIK